jgi:hypothetical protein
MGVNSDVVAPFETILQNILEYAMRTVKACHSVDYMVGQGVLLPSPFVDIVVCDVWTLDESECGNDFAVFFFYHITVAHPYVVFHKLLLRIAVGPLLCVAIFPHLLPAAIQNLHYGCYVHHARRAYSPFLVCHIISKVKKLYHIILCLSDAFSSNILVKENFLRIFAVVLINFCDEVSRNVKKSRIIS